MTKQGSVHSEKIKHLALKTYLDYKNQVELLYDREVEVEELAELMEEDFKELLGMGKEEYLAILKLGHNEYLKSLN